MMAKSRAQKTDILWAEDQKRYVEDIVDELKDAGVSVRLYTTCYDTLRALEGMEPPKLVLLDLWLPVGSPGGRVKLPAALEDGNSNTERAIWMYRQLRKDLPVTPIIILSGNLDVDTIKLLDEEGVSEKDRWKKPAPFDEFVTRVIDLTRPSE